MQVDNGIDGVFLDNEFLRKLELLNLFSRKVFRGAGAGERTSPKRGRSVEFADYRDYTMGDDFRYIDWNVYGRLEKLFLKLFVEETEISVYVLLDGSLSMECRSAEAAVAPAPSKFLYGKRLAAALAYIALARFDRVGLGVLRDAGNDYLPPVHGKQAVFQVFRFLSGKSAEGRTNLARSLREIARRISRPGLVIVISDFLDEQDFFDGLKFLMYQKNDLFLIQLLSEEEMRPSMEGDVKLVDVETGDAREITVTGHIMGLYRKALDDFTGEIRAFSMKSKSGYLLASTAIPFEDLVLEYLRVGRLIA